MTHSSSEITAQGLQNKFRMPKRQATTTTTRHHQTANHGNGKLLDELVVHNAAGQVQQLLSRAKTAKQQNPSGPGNS